MRTNGRFIIRLGKLIFATIFRRSFHLQRYQLEFIIQLSLFGASGKIRYDLFDLYFFYKIIDTIYFSSSSKILLQSEQFSTFLPKRFGSKPIPSNLRDRFMVIRDFQICYNDVKTPIIDFVKKSESQK